MKEETKPFTISKNLVFKAYKLVKTNKGSGGVDNESLADFDVNLKSNLYKIWNRMSSGSYLPPPVKGVEIPKKDGKKRLLGIPTVSDRIAQMTARLLFEPKVEPHFFKDSYGYRLNRSALDAVEVTRRRCWKYDWVLEFDIKGLFDNIDHELLLKAVEKHTEEKWIILYITRWLKAPLQLNDEIRERKKGTPQGGVISPVLANLFLHYAFDTWMKRNYPEVPWCRYADDGLLHCRTESEARNLLAALKERFEACKLEMHPEKTRIIYCKDSNREQSHKVITFDFLGYSFRPRQAINLKTGEKFTSFQPGVSKKALKGMTKKTRDLRLRNRTSLSLEDISQIYNPVLRGWVNYYGKFYPTALEPLWRHFNRTLASWAQKKYKKMRKHKLQSWLFIMNIAKRDPHLFVHWEKKVPGAFS
jgi:RNA-directed DNA polymerase